MVNKIKIHILYIKRIIISNKHVTQHQKQRSTCCLTSLCLVLSGGHFAFLFLFFSARRIIVFFFSFFLLLTWGYVLLIFQRERDRERNIDVREEHWSVASHMHPNQRSNMQPWCVPSPGIKPANFWCTGWCFHHLGHLARVDHRILLFILLTGKIGG